MTETHLLLGAIGSLSGVVAFLFGLYRSTYVAMEKRVGECEKDRKDLWERLIRVEVKTGCIPESDGHP